MREVIRHLVVALIVLAGCGDDEAPVIDVGPTGPPSVSFVDPPSGLATCVSIGTDPDARVPLLVEPVQLKLRPPGACLDFKQCGHLRLIAEGELNNEGAVPTIELLMRNLADRYHDGLLSPVGCDPTKEPEDGQPVCGPDYVDVRVEVVGETGEVLLDRDGHDLADTLQLVTAVDCDAP